MTLSSPPLAKVLLVVLADLSAVAGAVAMYLRSDSIFWLFAGVLASASITMVFLAPMLRAVAEARRAAAGKGANLVQ